MDQSKSHSPTRGILFSSFFRSYIKYRKARVRGSSIIQAETVYRKYLSSWHDVPVRDAFSYMHVLAIYKRIVNDPSLSSPWKNRIIGVIRSMAAVAYRSKRISARAYQTATAVLENVPEDKGQRQEKQIWTSREERRFLDVIEDENHKVMFSLFIELGARLSEFLGLTWDCYDHAKGIIVIKQQLLHNSQRTFELSSQLKTRESYRACRLSKAMKEMLNEYGKSAAGRFIFHAKENDELPYSKAAFRKLFNRYIEKAGVKRITPHAIRHAKASKLMKVCKNMLEVTAAARYMGHSVSIMMNVYTHSTDSTLKTVLRRLEKETL